MKKVIKLTEKDIEKLVSKIIREEKSEDLKKACWKGYEAVGMKTKNGKKVPNCVPIKENHEGESNNYMFWQNLETIKHAAEEMLAMDRHEVDEILSNGHGWALDHLATSADDVEEVYHFLEGNDEEEEEYEGDMEKEYEAYHESVKGRIIHADEFGFTELLPMTEGEGKGDCESRGLNKPWLTPDGPKKRSVCVKNGSGNVVKVNFGDPNMRIKKSDPERRKSFRARHKCENPGPKWKARYWSCKAW